METKFVATTIEPISGLLPGGRETVVGRVRDGLAVAIPGYRREKAANDLLDRVGAEEALVRRADGLANARKMRDAIVMVLALLGELDELMPDEPDRSAFHEIADLFGDVAGFAEFGAKAARQAAGAGNR